MKLGNVRGTYDLCDVLIDLIGRDTAVLLKQFPRPGQLRAVLGQLLLIALDVVQGRLIAASRDRHVGQENSQKNSTGYLE